MLALALDSQPEKEFCTGKGLGKKRVATRPLSLHERFVMKAEAIFPGSEVLSHQDSCQA